MCRWPRALILQAGKAVALEGGEDLPHVLARELEVAGDALLVPSLVPEADHRPAGPIGVVKLMKSGHGQRQLYREGMPPQKLLECVVVRLAPKLTLHYPRHLAQMDWWVELLEVEEVASYDVGVSGVARLDRRAPVDEPEHALFEEAVRLLGDGSAIQPRLPAALSDGLIREEDAADDLVFVLHRVGEAQGQLLEVLRGRHSWGGLRHAEGAASGSVARQERHARVYHAGRHLVEGHLPKIGTCHVAEPIDGTMRSEASAQVGTKLPDNPLHQP